MMTTRTVIGGPAAITFNGFTYFTEGDIALTPRAEARTVASSWHGPLAVRQTDRAVEIRFTPVGNTPGGDLSPYVPYGPEDLGRLVAPAQDADVAVVTAAGVSLTLRAGVITSVPELTLGPGGGPFGEMAITAMGGLPGKALGSAGSVWAASAAGQFAAALDAADIRTPGYALTLGSGQDAATVDSETDFRLSLGMTLEPVRASAYGTVNYRLSAVEPRLSFRPVGPDESGALSWLLLEGSALGSGATLGRAFSLAPVAGAGIRFSGSDCQVVEGAESFGPSSLRHGDFRLAPALAAGGAPLYTLAADA